MKESILEKVLAKIQNIERQDLERHFTNLAESQRAILAALDTLAEGILLIDRHTRITFMNAAARNMFSISSSEDKKWTLQNVITDRSLNELIASAVKNRENLINQEVRILSPRPLLLKVSLMAVKEDPEAYGYLAVVEDLTYSEEDSRGRLDREKIQSIINLVQGIAHEIGNPLNSIVVQLKLLQKELGNLATNRKQRISRIVGVLIEETNRLDRSVRQFLNFSRRPPLRFRKTNVNRVIQDVITLMAEELSERSITYTLELNREIPGFLADAEQLHRAFLNIVKNAMEAMPRGGNLAIRTERLGKLVKISFSDEGIGIPERDKKHIFDLYYTTKASGSGLGLAIVKNIIEEHDGRIDADSKIGKGSVFTVILPVRQQKLELPVAATAGEKET